MESTEKTRITVQVTVKASVETTWEAWTSPAAIMQWNNASADWHTTRSENDLRAGGKFVSRMEAKDGSMGFDFFGIYDSVIPLQHIEYTLGDDRKVVIDFSTDGKSTTVVETFEAETTNPVEMQRFGWQSIMDNFKKYVESKG